MDEATEKFAIVIHGGFPAEIELCHTCGIASGLKIVTSGG